MPSSIIIDLYYDFVRLNWLTAVGGVAIQPALVIGQSMTIDFRVRFINSSGVTYNPTNATWTMGMKRINDVDGPWLVQSSTGVRGGSGADLYTTFTLAMSSSELDTYLTEVDSVTNYAAFSIANTTDDFVTLPALTFTILPDYTLSGASPTDANGHLIVAAGKTFTVSQTFAMPTDNGTNGYLLKTNGNGVGTWVVDGNSGGTVTNVSVTTANGVSGTVANPTASAAITITLGAITPTTGAFSSTTASTTTTTGAVTVAGGLGVAGRANFGGALATGTVSTTIGTVTFYGTGTGSILLTPPAGNLGTTTLTLPTASTTLAGLSLTQTFSQDQTFSALINSTSTQDTSIVGADGAISTLGGLKVAKSLYVGTTSTFIDHAYFGGEVQTSDIRINAAETPLLISDYTNNAKIAGFNSVGDVSNYVTLENGIGAAHIYVSTVDFTPSATGLHLRALAGGFVNVEDSTDTTKRIKFDPSGNATTIIATIKTTATANATYTIPNYGTGGFLMDNSPYISANFLDWVGQTAVTIGASATATIGFGAATSTSLKTRVYSPLEYTSSVVAALVVGGGVYVAKKIQCASSITCTGTANSFGATTVTGNLTCGNLISTPEVVAMLGSSNGSISLSYLISLVSHGMSGTSIVTLGNGTVGQIKIITASSISAGSIAIGATTKTGFTTITMSASYNSITLVYIGTSAGWMISANYGCTIT